MVFECCKKNYEERPTIESINEKLVEFCDHSKNEELINVKNKCLKDDFHTISNINQDICQSYKELEGSNIKYREFVYKINNIPLNGYGIHTFEDGTIYKGLFENGKIKRYGKFIYNNNIIYEGQHNEGKWNGIGKLINKSNKTEYNGYFEDFKFSGYGIIYFSKDQNIKKILYIQA